MRDQLESLNQECESGECLHDQLLALCCLQWFSLPAVQLQNFVDVADDFDVAVAAVVVTKPGKGMKKLYEEVEGNYFHAVFEADMLVVNGVDEQVVIADAWAAL